MNKTAIASLIIIPLTLIIGIFYFGSELVNGNTVNVDAITFTQTETLVLDPGNVYDLECTVTPEDAEDKTVAFTSSDDAVVLVDTTGNIEALSYGTAIITVTTTDGGLTSVVTVIVSERLVTGVDLLKEATTLLIGVEETLEYTVSPTGAVNKEVSWTSSNELVATVNANGKVVAVGKGEAEITLTTSTDTDTGTVYTDSMTVTVKKDIESLLFTEDLIQSLTNDIDLNNLLNILPLDVTDELGLVTYSVNNTLATVTNGVLHFDQKGLVTVTVTSVSNPTLTDTLEVLYSDGYPLGISVDLTALYIDIYSLNPTGTITATILDASEIVSPKDVVTWSSSNETVATVDQFGVVIGLTEGLTTITATTADGEYDAETTVNVGTSYVGVDSVTLDVDSLDLVINVVEKITAVVAGTNSETATFTGVLWSVTGATNNFKLYENNEGIKGTEIVFSNLTDYRGNVLFIESLDGGEVIVTATSEDNSSVKTDSVTVTTSIEPDALEFTDDSIVGFNDSVNLSWNLTSTSGNIFPVSNELVTFTITSGNSIATISDSGLLDFTSVGTVTVEIKSVANDTLVDTITVTYANYELEETSKDIDSGSNYTIIAEGLSGNTYDFTSGYTLSVPAGASYSASDIVTETIVDGNLKLIGINHGTVIVTISASSGVFIDDERTFTLNVNEGPASIFWPLTSKTLDDYYVGTNGVVPLNYTLLGLDITDIFDDSVEIVFTSILNPLLTSDEIATVSNGEITFLQVGDSTLTITSSNNPSVSASFTYNVNDGYNVDTEQEIIDALNIGNQNINLVGNVYITGVNRDVFMATKAFSFFGNDYTIDATGVDIKTDDSNAQGVFALTLRGMTASDVVNFQDLIVIANTGYELGYRDMDTIDPSDDMYDGSRSLDAVQVTVVDGTRLGTLTVTDSDFSGGWVNVYIRNIDNAIFDNVDLTNAYCDSLYAEGNALIRLIDSTLGHAGYSAVDMATAVSLISNPDGILNTGDEIVQTLSIEGTTTLTNWIPASAEDSIFMKGEADYTLIYSMISGYITNATPHVVDVSTGVPMIGLSVTIFSQNTHTPVTTGTVDHEESHNFSIVITDLSANYNSSIIPVYEIVAAGMGGSGTSIAYGFDPASPTYIFSEKPLVPGE